jgi:hypothetical protein
MNIENENNNIIITKKNKLNEIALKKQSANVVNIINK